MKLKEILLLESADPLDAFAKEFEKNVPNYKIAAKGFDNDSMYLQFSPTAQDYRLGEFELVINGTFNDETSAAITGWQTLQKGASKKKRYKDHLDAAAILPNKVLARFSMPKTLENAALTIVDSLRAEGVIPSLFDRFIDSLQDELAKHEEIDPGYLEITKKNKAEIQIRYGKPYCLHLYGDFSSPKTAKITGWEFVDYEPYDGRNDIYAVKKNLAIEIDYTNLYSMHSAITSLVMQLLKAKLPD